MAVFPRLDEFVRVCGFSPSEQTWIVFSMVVMMPCTLAVFGWLIYSTYAYMLKQGRYKVLPLTAFYLLALVLVAAHFYTFFMFAEILLDYEVLPSLMFQTLMFAITLVQAWVNFELCYCLIHSRRQMQGESPVFPHGRIRCARKCVTLFIAFFVIGAFTCFIIAGR